MEKILRSHYVHLRDGEYAFLIPNTDGKTVGVEVVVRDCLGLSVVSLVSLAARVVNRMSHLTPEVLATIGPACAEIEDPANDERRAQLCRNLAAILFPGDDPMEHPGSTLVPNGDLVD